MQKLVSVDVFSVQAKKRDGNFSFRPTLSLVLVFICTFWVNTGSAISVEDFSSALFINTFDKQVSQCVPCLLY